MKIKGSAILFLVFLPLLANAQRGPGGVTVDTDNQKNCRLWLDAGDLIYLSDGDLVNVWHDKSLTAITVNDSAFWDPADADKYIAPTFRDAPSAGINGKPVVSYENGGMLKIGTWDGNNNGTASPDLNLNTPGYQTTYEQTVFVAFRTGNNVTANQTLWEEGGSNRGFKIYLRDDSVFIAAYDDTGSDNDPRASGVGKVPAFGFTYKGQAIQPNSTYVLSLVYDVPTGTNTNDGNKLITNSINPNPTEFSGLTGTLNGNPFPDNMQFGCCEADGVGGVHYHPDPIGLGGLNRTSYDEAGRMTNQGTTTGSRLFQGRLAEVCYYAFAMDDAERIIVENYLAAKYFANVIANDKYGYEAGYGDGVIGIGKEQNSIDHNISQGDNIFEISVISINSAFPLNAPQYLLVGHNNGQLNWTTQNTPDTASIQRLGRIWRWDRSGTTPANLQVKIKLYPEDIAKLPLLPPGYTKYGILQESASQHLPNFNSANSTVTELFNYSSLYVADVNIHDGEFFTICAIKPTAQFALYSDYAIESSPPPLALSKRTKLRLNYKPTSNQPTTVGFNFVDITAISGIDYNPAVVATATFAPLRDTTSIGFEIINNIVATNPPTKKFNIILDPLTTPGVAIGARDTLSFSIYDDDPEPKITFVVADSSISEGAGLARVRVQVLGTTVVPSQIMIIRPELPAAGSATYDIDYTLPSGAGWYTYQATKKAIIVTVPAGNNQTASVYFPIFPDASDEYDETIEFHMEPYSGVGVGIGSILTHTLTILDDDEEPTVSFLTASSEGFEAINNPRLYITLNTPSAKEVTVNFEYLGGSATPSPLPNSDFSSPSMGTVVFEPGSIEEYFSLIVYSNDSTPEADNTVIFKLIDPVHAALGNPTEHTYTIKDYTEFEWLGVAGIGKFSDNTFWMVPDGANPGTDITSIPNLSPRPVNLIQDIAEKAPSVTTAVAGLNNHKMVVFHGDDNLKVGGTGQTQGQYPLINTGGQYDRKSIFFVFSPDDVTSATPQIIYEQGGGSNGMSIYMIGNKLYFYMYFIANGAYSPWGFVNNNSNTNSLGQAYVESATDLQAGQNYIVSCHYSRNWGYEVDEMPPLAGMHLYINGILEDSYTTDSEGNYRVGRMYTHTGYASIGAMWHQGKTHTITTNGPNQITMDYHFKGKIGEFLYFNEPLMTETRVRILHNYFASKYNLLLGGGTQDFDLDYADNTPTSINPAFNYQVAGVGIMGNSVHGNSQGQSELRITNPTFTQNPAFLNWGHNNENLTNTWPYSNSHLPSGILERSGKTWRFSTSTGGVDFADFLIRFNTVQNAPIFQTNPQFLKLLVNTGNDPNDFSNATVYDAVSPNPNGNVAKFTQVAISDGMYVSLANTSAIYPLPVELLNFNAVLNGQSVDIFWTTSTEFNNDYFIIERSGNEFNWMEIAKVQGAGNSNTTLYYNEKDRNPLTGISYYRLKQVDYDGEYKYTDIVSVVNSVFDGNEDVFLFPNPSNSMSVFVRIPYAYSKNSTKVSFYNMSGVNVWETRLESNLTLSELKYGDLPTGVYIVEFRSDLLYDVKKLVIKN